MSDFSQLNANYTPTNKKDPNYKTKMKEKVKEFTDNITANGSSNTQVIKEGETGRTHGDGTVIIDKRKDTESTVPVDNSEYAFLDDDLDLGDGSLDPRVASQFGAKKISFEDEFGEKVEREINLDKEEELTDLIKKAHQTESIQAEIEALRDEVASKEKILKAEREKINKWLTLEASGREALLNDIFKDEGGIEGYKKAIIEEHERYMNLSDDDRKEYDAKRERAEALKREKALQDKMEKMQKQIEENQNKSVQEQFLQQFRENFNKVKFPNESNDYGITAINTTMFNEIKKNLSELKNQGITITNAIMARECKKAQAALRKSVSLKKEKEDANKMRKQEYANQLDEAASATQSLDADNSPGESVQEIYKRWRQMIKQGKKRSILTEVSKNPKLMPVYQRFGELLMNRRKF